MVLDTRLVNLETCIGEVSLHNNLLHWCNGKQNGLFDFWFSDSCVKGVWNGCKQHLIVPFYYLLNIPCTAEMQWKSIVFHWHGSFVIFLAFSWLSPSLLTFFPHFFLSFFFLIFPLMGILVDVIPMPVTHSGAFIETAVCQARLIMPLFPSCGLE